MQMERYTVGSTGQTELNDTDIFLMKIVYQESSSEQEEVVRATQTQENSALQSRSEYGEEMKKARS